MAVELEGIQISIDAKIDNFNRTMRVVDNELGKLKRQSAIAIPVNDKQLHGLNDLIDKKIKHLGELRKEAGIPIAPIYDPKSLSAGINQIKEFRREWDAIQNDILKAGNIGVTVNHNIRIDNHSLAGDVRNVGKEVKDGLKEVTVAIHSQKQGIFGMGISALFKGFFGGVGASGGLRMGNGIQASLGLDFGDLGRRTGADLNKKIGQLNEFLDFVAKDALNFHDGLKGVATRTKKSFDAIYENILNPKIYSELEDVIVRGIIAKDTFGKKKSELSAEQQRLRELFIESKDAVVNRFIVEIEESVAAVAGAVIKTASIPVRIRKRVITNESAQKVSRQIDLFREEYQQANVSSEIKKSEGIAFVVGGIDPQASKPGKPKVETTHQQAAAMKSIMPKAYVEPITPYHTVSVETLEAGNYHKLMREQILPIVEQNKEFLLQFFTEKQINDVAANLKNFHPLETLIAQNLDRGYNIDSLRVATKALAAGIAHPDKPITIAGGSAGGAIVEEAIAIINEFAQVFPEYQKVAERVKGFGIGMPLANLTSTANSGKQAAQYRSYLGTHDQVGKGFFGSALYRGENIDPAVQSYLDEQLSLPSGILHPHPTMQTLIKGWGQKHEVGKMVSDLADPLSEFSILLNDFYRGQGKLTDVEAKKVKGIVGLLGESQGKSLQEYVSVLAETIKTIANINKKAGYEAVQIKPLAKLLGQLKTANKNGLDFEAIGVLPNDISDSITAMLSNGFGGSVAGFSRGAKTSKSNSLLAFSASNTVMDLFNTISRLTQGKDLFTDKDFSAVDERISSVEIILSQLSKNAQQLNLSAGDTGSLIQLWEKSDPGVVQSRAKKEQFQPIWDEFLGLLTELDKVHGTQYAEKAGSGKKNATADFLWDAANIPIVYGQPSYAEMRKKYSDRQYVTPEEKAMEKALLKFFELFEKDAEIFKKEYLEPILNFRQSNSPDSQEQFANLLKTSPFSKLRVLTKANLKGVAKKGGLGENINVEKLGNFLTEIVNAISEYQVENFRSGSTDTTHIQSVLEKYKGINAMIDQLIIESSGKYQGRIPDAISTDVIDEIRQSLIELANNFNQDEKSITTVPLDVMRYYLSEKHGRPVYAESLPVENKASSVIPNINEPTIPPYSRVRFNPIESGFTAKSTELNSSDELLKLIHRELAAFHRDMMGGNGYSNDNPTPPTKGEPGGELVLLPRRPDDDIPPAGAIISDPWNDGPGGAGLKQAGKNAMQSIRDMADVAGKVTQAVPLPAKLMTAAIAGKIAFNTMGIDAPIEHLVQSLFGHAGDVIVNAITNTVKSHTDMAVADVNQSLHSILDSMAQFQDIEPATNAVEKVVNFFKAIGNARSEAMHIAVEPLIDTVDAALKNGSASIEDVVRAIITPPIHQTAMLAGHGANIGVDIVGGAAVGGLASGAIKRTGMSQEEKLQMLLSSAREHRQAINQRIETIQSVKDIEDISQLARHAKEFISAKQDEGGLPRKTTNKEGDLVLTNRVLGGWKGNFDQFLKPEDILKKAHGMGVAIPDGILQALQERGHLPKDATIEMLREMITGSKKILKSNSPSLVFKQIGSDIVAGLDQGLDFSQVAQKVPKEMAAIIGDIESIIKREVAQAKHSGHDLTNSLATTLGLYYEWGGGSKSALTSTSKEMDQPITQSKVNADPVLYLSHRIRPFFDSISNITKNGLLDGGELYRRGLSDIPRTEELQAFGSHVTYASPVLSGSNWGDQSQRFGSIEFLIDPAKVANRTTFTMHDSTGGTRLSSPPRPFSEFSIHDAQKLKSEYPEAQIKGGVKPTEFIGVDLGNLEDLYAKKGKKLIELIESIFFAGVPVFGKNAQRMSGQLGEQLSKSIYDATQIAEIAVVHSGLSLSEAARKAYGMEWQSIGLNINKGLTAGIVGSEGEPITAITNTSEKLINTTKEMLGIHSPSTLFKKFGYWITEGLAIGVDSGTYLYAKSLLKLDTMAADRLASFKGQQVRSAGQAFVNNLFPPAGAFPSPEPPRRMGDNAKDFISNRADDMVAGIAKAPQNADKGFWEWLNNILDEIEAGAGAAGAGIRGLGRIMGALEEKMPGLSRIIENIKGFAGGLLMYMGFQQIEQVLVDFGRQGIDTALQLERMKAALTYDSSINAASKLKEIAQYADEIGANALVAAQSFIKLTIAAANTTVAPQVQKIFEGFSTALVGQGATPDEQQRAFLAVQQMIGKGQILAEELRSQLAEVMPQAIGAMARSQGLTQEQLTNQMKNSKLYPETDLQPLAKQLSYEATLPINAVKEGPLGSIARFQNAQEKLQGRMGETILTVGKPAMDLAAGGMNALNGVATGLTASLGLLVAMLAGKFIYALLDTNTAGRIVTIMLKTLGLEFMTNNWMLNGLNTGLAKLNTGLVVSGTSANVAVRGFASLLGAISGVGLAIKALAPQLIAFAAIGYAIDRGTKIWRSYHSELKKTNDELEAMINNLEATNTLTGQKPGPNDVDRSDPTYTRLGGSNPTPITGIDDYVKRVLGGVINNYTRPFEDYNNVVIDYRDEKGNITKSVKIDRDERRDMMQNLAQVDRSIEQAKRLIAQAESNYASPTKLAEGKAKISQLDQEIAAIRTRLANNSKLGGNNREEFKNLSAELAVKVGKRETAVNEYFGNQIALEQVNKVLEAGKVDVQKNPDTQARNAKLEAINKAMSGSNVILESIRMNTGSINQKIPGLIGASQLVSSAGANVAEYNQGLASQRNNALLNARLNGMLDDIDLQRQQAFDTLTTARREYLPVKQDSETFKNFALNGLTPNIAQEAMNRLELRGRGGEKYKDPLEMIMNTSVETMKALAESGTDLYPGLKEFLDNAVKFKEKYQQANELEGKVLQAQIEVEKLQQQRLNIIRQANTEIAASNTNIEMYRAASKGQIGTKDIEIFTAYNDLAKAKSQLENVKALANDSSKDPVELAQQLTAAQEAVAKAEFAVIQSGQNTEEYYLGLGQSVEDFNRSVLETQIGWTQQIRDFGWTVQDSARNAFVETRGLQEAWTDLQLELEGQLLAAQNEFLSASEKLRQTKATLAVEQIGFQPDSIGKKTASIFVDFLSNIGNLEGEGRSLDEKQRQLGQEYVTTLRRIRDEQEKQLKAEEERTRSIIRLNEQFRSLMMQMESSSIKLGRELEQIITRITREAPNSGYQNKVSSLPTAPLSYNPSAGIDPRYGDAIANDVGIKRVPFSVPIGQPIVGQAADRPGAIIKPTIDRTNTVVQPTKRYAPGDANGLNELMDKYGGGMSLNIVAPKQEIPAQSILTAPAQAATTNKKMATADLITQIAKRLGANPRELAALISFESAGTFSPDKMGGTGNNYQGWIQFSPDARKRYGVRKGQSIEQHAEATYRYLYDRLKRNGDLDEPTLKNLYNAINPGFSYTELTKRLQKHGHWRNADRLMNLQSSIPKEWLIAEASEGISDMGSAILGTNAAAAARAKRIEAEKARKRQTELSDPNNISRKSLEDIIKYQKELYPEAFKLDDFYESKGIKFIDRMTSKDWKKRSDAIAKQFKESQARVDAAKGIGGSNANLNPNIEKYQTLPGYQPSQLEPQVDMNGGNVLPNPYTKGIVEQYQPKAINDYSSLQQIKDQSPITVQDTSGLTATAGQINDVKNATIDVNRAVLELQGNLELVKFNNAFEQQLQSIQDMARNLGRKVEDNNIKYRELVINSKGYKTAADDINLAVEGVATQFRQMNRDFEDEIRNLGRQMNDAYIGAAVAAKALADKQAELTKEGRQATAQELQWMAVYRENLKLYTDSIPPLQARKEEIEKQSKAIAAQEEPTKRATEAWLRLDEIMAAKQGFAKVQAELYKTRYDVGAQNSWGMGTLIDPSAVINARMQAAQAKVDLEKQIREGGYSSQQANQMRRFQTEISELNIKRSFVDAIPGLKEFSSGLKDAILYSKGLGESLNKIKDVVLGMALEQLVIKPVQNAIAEFVGPMLGLDSKEFYPQTITRLGEQGASIAANNIVPFELNNALTDLTDSTTNTSQAMDNIFLAGITSTDSAMVGFIAGLTQATAALSAFTSVLAVGGAGHFIDTGSNIFGNLFNASNASAGQSVADSLSGGFTGILSHVFNFADGGPIADAINRERIQSGGRTPILAVLNTDEYVIPADEASEYLNYKDWSQRMSKDVKNFAKGGPVSYIPRSPQTNTSEGTVNNFYQNTTIEVANTNDLGKSMSQIERDRQLAKLRAGVR